MAINKRNVFAVEKIHAAYADVYNNTIRRN